jgi:hypothetical protein
MLMGIDWAGNEEWRWILDSTNTTNGSYLEGIIPVSSGGYLAFGRLAQDGNYTYLLRIKEPSGISGVVMDAVFHQPLANVQVKIPAWSGHYQTDLSGRFSLLLPQGIYDVVATTPCATNDTAFAITVTPASFASDTLNMDKPSVVLPSSLSIITYNDMLVNSPYQLHNAGTGTLVYYANITTIRPTSNWIDVSPHSGSVPPGQDGNLTFVIQADTSNTGVFDFQALLHLRTNACPDTVKDIPLIVAVMGADEHESTLPQKYELAAYPNPFNPTSTITLALPKQAQGKLTVFDINGRIVSTLGEGMFTAGNHRFAFDASALPSGIYFAHFVSAEFTQTQKLMLLK